MGTVAQQDQLIQHNHSQGHCKDRQQLDEWAMKLGWIGQIKQIGIQVTAKCNNVIC